MHAMTIKQAVAVNEIRKARQQIWHLTGGNTYFITLAKQHISFNESQPDYPALLAEVKRMKERKLPASCMPTVRQAPAPVLKQAREEQVASVIPGGTNQYDTLSMQQRYQQAHRRWFAEQYPAATKDGHYLAPKYPSVDTSNGLTDLVQNYLKWMGHHQVRTNNIGRSRVKMAPKFNIMSGKVEQVIIGQQYLKSTTKKGQQDIDCNLKHPDHKYGIPWKIEIKCKATRDRQSDDQVAFAARVQETGAVYSVIRTDADFFSQYDGLLRRESIPPNFGSNIIIKTSRNRHL